MIINEKKLIKNALIIAIFIALIGSLGVSIKLYYDSEEKLVNLKKEYSLSGRSQEESDEEIYNRVSAHIILPPEEPKIITISNVSQLKRDQPFFINAQDGDKLLAFSNKVILYSPSQDKVIEVAQIKVDPKEFEQKQNIATDSSQLLEIKLR